MYVTRWEKEGVQNLLRTSYVYGPLRAWGSENSRGRKPNKIDEVPLSFPPLSLRSTDRIEDRDLSKKIMPFFAEGTDWPF